MTDARFNYKSRGFALAAVLVLLIPVTLLALVASRLSVVSESAAASQRDFTKAYFGAEAAVRAAEGWLLNFSTHSAGSALVASNSSSNGLYSRGAAQTVENLRAFLEPRRWHVAGSVALSDDWTDPSNSGRLDVAPRYVVEDLGSMRPPGAGVTAEGGISGNTGYEGSTGVSPSGNSDMRVFRVFGKSVGAEDSNGMVMTLWSIFAGRAQG